MVKHPFVSLSVNEILSLSLGGFHSLKFQVGAKYPSELAEGGFVTWTNTNAVDNTVGPIDFPNVRYKVHNL
jgi:hypothetical protein